MAKSKSKSKSKKCLCGATMKRVIDEVSEAPRIRTQLQCPVCKYVDSDSLKYQDAK